MARDAHFVGSVGLPSPLEVYAAIGERLGTHIKRCPDGEPGGRRMWIGWQWPVLRASSALELASRESIGHSGFCPLKVKKGARDADLEFGELGYYREALGSYQEFVKAREQGLVARSVRFQVSLPTPWAVVRSFIAAPDVNRVLPFYLRAMSREIAAICSGIPRNDLALQWDVCIELVQLHGGFAWYPSFEGMDEVFATQFAALGSAVPRDVQLGVHLCYGDLDGEPFINPTDTGKVVQLANLIAARAGRPIDWIHLPVPANRGVDAAYYSPLRQLNRSPGSDLYLGLLHTKDGVDGTRARIAAARQVVPDFGVSTECGIARARTKETVNAILDLYADAVEAG